MRLLEKEFQISNKELANAFPELYDEYKKLYGSKRPKIDVSVATEYSFRPSVSDYRSDYVVSTIYFFYQDGDVAYFDATVDGGEGNVPFGKYQLGDKDCVLVCHTGYSYQYCELTVNPSFINQKALPEPVTLTPAQEYVLIIFNNIKPFAREQTFFGFTYQGKLSLGSEWMYNRNDLINEIKHDYGTDDIHTAYTLIIEDLVDLGLISSSNRLTPEGKNTVIWLKNNGDNRQYK